MEENMLIAPEEEKGKNTTKLVRILIAVLAVLGLITSAAVVAGFLYKKFKRTIKAFNEDIVYDPLEESDLEGQTEGEAEGASEGCDVSFGEEEET